MLHVHSQASSFWFRPSTLIVQVIWRTHCEFARGDKLRVNIVVFPFSRLKKLASMSSDVHQRIRLGMHSGGGQTQTDSSLPSDIGMLPPSFSPRICVVSFLSSKAHRSRASFLTSECSLKQPHSSDRESGWKREIKFVLLQYAFLLEMKSPNKTNQWIGKTLHKHCQLGIMTNTQQPGGQKPKSTFQAYPYTWSTCTIMPQAVFKRTQNTVTQPHTHTFHISTETSIKVTRPWPAKAPRNMRLVAVGPSTQSAAPAGSIGRCRRWPGQARPRCRWGIRPLWSEKEGDGPQPQAAVHAWALVLFAFASGLGGLSRGRLGHGTPKAWACTSILTSQRHGWSAVCSSLGFEISDPCRCPCTCQVTKLWNGEQGRMVLLFTSKQLVIGICNSRVMLSLHAVFWGVMHAQLHIHSGSASFGDETWLARCGSTCVFVVRLFWKYRFDRALNIRPRRPILRTTTFSSECQYCNFSTRMTKLARPLP